MVHKNGRPRWSLLSPGQRLIAASAAAWRPSAARAGSPWHTRARGRRTAGRGGSRRAGARAPGDITATEARQTVSPLATSNSTRLHIIQHVVVTSTLPPEPPGLVLPLQASSCHPPACSTGRHPGSLPPGRRPGHRSRGSDPSEGSPAHTANTVTVIDRHQPRSCGSGSISHAGLVDVLWS